MQTNRWVIVSIAAILLVATHASAQAGGPYPLAPQQREWEDWAARVLDSALERCAKVEDRDLRRMALRIATASTYLTPEKGLPRLQRAEKLIADRRLPPSMDEHSYAAFAILVAGVDSKLRDRYMDQAIKELREAYETEGLWKTNNPGDGRSDRQQYLTHRRRLLGRELMELEILAKTRGDLGAAKRAMLAHKAILPKHEFITGVGFSPWDRTLGLTAQLRPEVAAVLLDKMKPGVDPREWLVQWGPPEAEPPEPPLTAAQRQKLVDQLLVELSNAKDEWDARSVLNSIFHCDPNAAFDLIIAGTLFKAEKPNLDFSRIDVRRIKPDRLLEAYRANAGTLTTTVFRPLAVADPEFAEAEARKMPADLREECLALVASGIARTDRARALRIVAELPKERQEHWRFDVDREYLMANPGKSADIQNNLKGFIVDRVAYDIARNGTFDDFRAFFDGFKGQEKEVAIGRVVVALSEKGDWRKGEELAAQIQSPSGYVWWTTGMIGDRSRGGLFVLDGIEPE